MKLQDSQGNKTRAETRNDNWLLLVTMEFIYFPLRKKIEKSLIKYEWKELTDLSEIVHIDIFRSCTSVLERETLTDGEGNNKRKRNREGNKKNSVCVCERERERVDEPYHNRCTLLLPPTLTHTTFTSPPTLCSGGSHLPGVWSKPSLIWKGLKYFLWRLEQDIFS